MKKSDSREAAEAIAALVILVVILVFVAALPFAGAYVVIASVRALFGPVVPMTSESVVAVAFLLIVARAIFGPKAK